MRYDYAQPFNKLSEDEQNTVVRAGMWINNLANSYPVTVPELLNAALDAAQYIGLTRIDDVRELFFIDGDSNRPRLIKRQIRR